MPSERSADPMANGNVRSWPFAPTCGGRWLVSFREQTGPTPKARCDANDPQQTSQTRGRYILTLGK
jgi:hypothetical protein